MQPIQKIKFNDWYMKMDPPMWIAADFECMSLLINDNNNDDDNNDDNVNDIDHNSKMVISNILVKIVLNGS